MLKPVDTPRIRAVFDFPITPDGPPSRRTLGEPSEVVVARSLDDVRPVLGEVEAAVARGLDAAGFVTYEAAPAFEPKMQVRSGGRMPLLWFGLFERERRRARRSPDHVTGRDRVAGPDRPTDPDRWAVDLSRPAYDAAVEAVREAIAAGRSYQANLTARLETPWPPGLDPLALYERLRRAQGPGFHAFLDTGRFVVVSVSPELFFHRAGGRVTTRPMKGTRPRGRWWEEDEDRRRDLLSSEKDLAENRMIVDLLRNDLGRVAEVGSVQVPRVLEVERYRTVLQLTSTVTARVPDSRSLVDLFAALFPCGSVTGAPKISTMELLGRLEATPREVYCGAIGFLDGATGDATFNVPIRTLWMDREQRTLHYGSGGGITWDSRAEDEYGELRAKTRVLNRSWPDFDLLETMRLEDGRIVRLDRHLARMERSAAYFARPFPEAEIRDALRKVASERPSGRWRVRLTVGGSVGGQSVRTRAEPLPDGEMGAPGPAAAFPAATPETAAAPPRPVILSEEPVDERDPFLFHKTTHRAVYREARARHPGAFDVLLLNRAGRVTEFTRGNLLAEVDGQWVTPPREDGLLAGCLRNELLARGAVREGSLIPDQLRRAPRLLFVNSLRGCLPVDLRGRG